MSSPEFGLIDKARLWVCGVDLDQMKSMVGNAEEWTKYGAQLSRAGTFAPGAGKQLERAADTIHKANGNLSTMSTALTDVGAFCELNEALSTLSGWEYQKGTVSNAEAAAAFDKMFGAIAVFAEKLPAPFDQYAKLLKEISIAQFFTRMNQLGESRVGGNGSTPTGRAMQEINAEFRRQGGGGID